MVLSKNLAKNLAKNLEDAVRGDGLSVTFLLNFVGRAGETAAFSYLCGINVSII